MDQCWFEGQFRDESVVLAHRYVVKGCAMLVFYGSWTVYVAKNAKTRSNSILQTHCHLFIAYILPCAREVQGSVRRRVC